MELEYTCMFFKGADEFLKLKAWELKQDKFRWFFFCLHQRAQGKIDAIWGDVLLASYKSGKTHSPNWKLCLHCSCCRAQCWEVALPETAAQMQLVGLIYGIQTSYICFGGSQNWCPSVREVLPVRALQLEEALVENQFPVCSFCTQLFHCNMTLYGCLCNFMLNFQSCWERRKYTEAQVSIVETF